MRTIESSGSACLWEHWDGVKYSHLSGSGLNTELGNFSQFISSSLYTGEYEASDSWTDANKRKLTEWLSEIDLNIWRSGQSARAIHDPAVPRHEAEHTSSAWLDPWE